MYILPFHSKQYSRQLVIIKYRSNNEVISKTFKTSNKITKKENSDKNSQKINRKHLPA